MKEHQQDSRRSRVFIASWGAATAWLLAMLGLAEFWRGPRDTILGCIIVVGVYLAVPGLCAVSLEKVGAILACLVAVTVVVLATSMQLVFGRGFATSVLVGNVVGIATHSAMGAAGVALLVRRERRIVLPLAAEDNAAEQAHAPDGRAPGCG